MGIEQTGMTTDEEIAQLEGLLADLELPENDAAEAEAVSADEVLSEEIEAAVEQQIARDEVYAGTEAPAGWDVADTSTEETVVEAPAKPAKEKKARAPKAPKAPKLAKAPSVERDLEKIDEGFFQLYTDVLTERAPVLAARPAQKKIAEKFDNLFQALAASKKPSTFTMDVFKILDVKKVVTSAELVAALKDDGYSDGTARSQVGQMMVLFPVLAIATRKGQTLEAVENSRIAERLRVFA